MRFFLQLFSLIFVFGCSSVQKRSIMVNNGDTKENVIKIMGTPGNRQFRDNLEAWQYCDTSFGHYNFALIWFSSGSVIGINTYSGDPAPFSGCDNHYSPVKWESAPNQTIEIRNR